MSVVPQMDDEVRAARSRVIEQFRTAWEAGDVDALMALMTDDAEFRASVGPEPGRTFRGAAEIEQGFRQFLSMAPTNASTTNQDDLICPDFAVTRWSTRTVGADGKVTEARACDVFEFEGDLIRVKDTYRKVVSL